MTRSAHSSYIISVKSVRANVLTRISIKESEFVTGVTNIHLLTHKTIVYAALANVITICVEPGRTILNTQRGIV